MPKLTLRDLFAVVTIVALALGWWLDHWSQAAHRQDMARTIEYLEDELAALKPSTGRAEVYVIPASDQRGPSN
jgi:hypothetical protein